MFDEALARYSALNAQMRSIYEPAWERAMARDSSINDRNSDSRSLSSSGAPLRLAESAGKDRGGSVSQASEYGKPGMPSDTGIPSTSNNSARPNDAGNGAEAESGFMGASEGTLRPDGAPAKPAGVVYGTSRFSQDGEHQLVTVHVDGERKLMPSAKKPTGASAEGTLQVSSGDTAPASFASSAGEASGGLKGTLAPAGTPTKPAGVESGAQAAIGRHLMRRAPD